jgi:hypothetical protein
VWRLAAADANADADAPAFGTTLALRVATPAHGVGVACLQLAARGDILAWATGGSDVAVARVPPECADTCADVAAAALLYDTDAFVLSTLSFADDDAADAGSGGSGGALAHALVLGTDGGLLALPGALARGTQGGLAGVARVRLSVSAAVTCHQQGIAGTPSLVAAAEQGGGVRVFDARLPARSAAAITLSAPDAGAPTALCLHACGAALAAGHADGSAAIYDLRAPAAPRRADVGGGRHRDRCWALHCDETRLVTAGLDAALIVRHWAE